MADFCNQCSEELFGEGTGDFQNLISKEDIALGFKYMTVLCEGCGPICIDYLGNCDDPECEKHSCVTANKSV